VQVRARGCSRLLVAFEHALKDDHAVNYLDGH
jgi:hypothetical protein